MPRFLLASWEAGPDKKLTRFSRLPSGELNAVRRKAKGVGKITGLYSLAAGDDRNTIERDFLGPYIDDPGAVAHDILLRYGTEGLDKKAKVDWTRFVVSLFWRMPDRVAWLKLQASGALEHEFLRREGNDAEFDKFKSEHPDFPYDTAWEVIRRHFPYLLQDFGIRLLPRALQNPDALLPLGNAIWGYRDVSAGTRRFIISDQPLYRYAGKGSFLFLLPISPTRLFCASPHPGLEIVMDWPTDDELVEAVNRLQLQQHAVKFAFAQDEAERDLIERFLPREDP